MEFIKYVVKENDTMFGIAKSFNVTVNDLLVANDLVTPLIYPGQILLIPKENQEDHAKGEVYLTMFEFLDTTPKLKGIQVRYLLASLVYENYLNSRIMKLDAINL